MYVNENVVRIKNIYKKKVEYVMKEREVGGRQKKVIKE